MRNHLRREDSTATGYALQNISTSPSTIALFGAGSKTAHHFLRLSLDAGYQVRALLIQNDYQQTAQREEPSKACKIAKELVEEFADQPALKFVTAESVYDVDACQRVLRGADYVVCMMNDAPFRCEPLGKSKKKKQQSKKKSESASIDKPLTTFLETLYPLMKQQASIQVFLYQATSLASDVKGKTPILSQILKTASVVGGAAANVLSGVKSSKAERQLLRDHDAAIQQIACNHHRCAGQRLSGGSSKNNNKRQSTDSNESDDLKENDDKFVKAHFSYIITRPTALLKDGPSTKKVMASKSQPGPFPISHVDLAEFSLNALLSKKLYNSCPYVVADSF